MIPWKETCRVSEVSAADDARDRQIIVEDLSVRVIHAIHVRNEPVRGIAKKELPRCLRVWAPARNVVALNGLTGGLLVTLGPSLMAKKARGGLLPAGVAHPASNHKESSPPQSPSEG